MSENIVAYQDLKKKCCEMEAQGSVCLSLRVFARSVLPNFGYHAPTYLVVRRYLQVGSYQICQEL